MKVTDLLNNVALEYGDFELPSKGKVYETGTSTIKIRPTRTAEEKFLRTIARGSSDLNEKLSKYLGSVTNLEEIGLDPTSLTVADQLAILIYSRIISKDTVQYPIGVTCASCGKASRKVINLMELQKIYLPEDYVEPQEIYLPIHDITLGVRLIRVKDHMEVAEYHRTMQKVNIDLGDPESDYEALYAKIITSVKKGDEDIKIGFTDKRDLLLNLDAKSFNLISDFQDKYYHGYDLTTNFECPHCLEKNTASFELSADFFFKITSINA